MKIKIVVTSTTRGISPAHESIKPRRGRGQLHQPLDSTMIEEDDKEERESLEFVKRTTPSSAISIDQSSAPGGENSSEVKEASSSSS